MTKQLLFGILLVIISGILVMTGALLKLNNHGYAGFFLNFGILVWLVCLVYFGVLIGIKLLKPSKKAA